MSNPCFLINFATESRRKSHALTSGSGEFFMLKVAAVKGAGAFSAEAHPNKTAAAAAKNILIIIFFMVFLLRYLTV